MDSHHALPRGRQNIFQIAVIYHSAAKNYGCIDLGLARLRILILHQGMMLCNCTGDVFGIHGRSIWNAPRGYGWAPNIALPPRPKFLSGAKRQQRPIKRSAILHVIRLISACLDDLRSLQIAL
eukprot:3068347-Amphidinium_carterae.1